MIVEPDFLSHWKTLMLVDELQDKAAPLYVISLWAHCQQRKTDAFDIPPAALRSVCRYEGDPSELYAALERCGFIKPTDTGFKVHGWAEANAKLIANWTNGPKGGRPKKNPTETHEKPNDNPTVTHEEPTANPQETDKIDKIDKKEECGGKRASGMSKPTIEEVEEYAVSLGLPKTDGTACFNKWTGNGWKNGGSAIKDWKATIRSWQLHGYLPSQKGGTGTATTAAAAKIRMV